MPEAKDKDSPNNDNQSSNEATRQCIPEPEDHPLIPTQKVGQTAKRVKSKKQGGVNVKQPLLIQSNRAQIMPSSTSNPTSAQTTKSNLLSRILPSPGTFKMFETGKHPTQKFYKQGAKKKDTVKNEYYKSGE